MKKNYEVPECVVRYFEVEDVIAVSGATPPSGSLSYADDPDVAWKGLADFNQLK